VILLVYIFVIINSNKNTLGYFLSDRG